MIAVRIVSSWYPSLAVPAYLRLWLGIVPYNFAFQFGIVVTGVAAVALADSAFVVALVVGAWGIPILVVPPFGGAVADRLSRKRVMLGAQVVLGAGALLVAMLASSGALQAWHLVALGLVQGTTYAFFAPARTAYTVSIVERPLIPNAIAAYSLIDYGSGVLGPAAAGIALGLLGLQIEAGYFLIAGIHLLVFVMFARLPDQRVEPSDPGAGILARVGAAIRYIRVTPPLPAILVLAAVMSFLGVSFQALMPVFAEQVFRAGAGGLGALLTATGIGAIGGALTSARVRGDRHLARWQRFFAVALGVAVLGFALSPGFAVALVAAAAAGFAASAAAVVNAARMLVVSESAMHGRVSSFYQLTFALGPLGAMALGALADVVGPPASVALGGITLVVLAVVLTARQRRIADA